MSPRARWAGSGLSRAASIVAGAVVLYRQAFVVKEAQEVLVGLGVWLMAVPPALWYDQLRRFSRAAVGEPPNDAEEQ